MSLGLVMLLLLADASAEAGPSDAGAQPEIAHAAATPRDTAQARRDHKAALARLRAGALEEAVRLLERAQAADPQSAVIATDWGYVLAKLGRGEQAERAFRWAIEHKPDRYYAYAHLADLIATDATRWARGDDLVKLLTEGIDRVARDASARVNLTLALARFERSIGRIASARARLGRLLENRPTSEQRKRVLDVLDGLARAERARALEDWPEPEVPAAERAAEAQAQRAQAAGRASDALRVASGLIAKHVGWRAPLWLRARIYHRLGRFDDAVTDLVVLTQLAPSFASAWRLLGQILVAHGGPLEAESADEALRVALALEPAWDDLWILRARVALRRRKPEEALHMIERLVGGSGEWRRDSEVEELSRTARMQLEASSAQRPPEAPPVPAPSERARQLLRDAQGWIASDDPLDLAHDLVRRALEDSPGFIDAAVTAHSLGMTIPEATLETRWNDGAALLDLARRIRKLDDASHGAAGEPIQPIPIVRRCLDRAVELDAEEARFERALLRVHDGDAKGALADLLVYSAGAPRPEHLDEARALRAALAAVPKSDDAELLVRQRLIEGKPEGALAILGTSCDAQSVRSVPVARLLLIGKVHEYAGHLVAALGCYGEAGARQPESALALERIARIAARLPSADLAPLAVTLERAASRGILTASWPLARLSRAQGHSDEALHRIETFLRAVPPDDPSAKAAVLARQEILGAVHAAGLMRMRHRNLWMAMACIGIVLLAALTWRRKSLARGLRARPELFPTVAALVDEIRHEALKHRASGLSVLGTAGAARGEIARSLREPEPLSTLVERHYQAFRGSARAKGVRLWPLSLEPTLGPLTRDLRQAERWIEEPARTSVLVAIDTRLRGLHWDRLGALLNLGPQTELDAPLLARWIRTVESEVRHSAQKWIRPGIAMQEVELRLPVDPRALYTIFSNLLRNAATAVGETGQVLVRIEVERDATGRRQARLLVVDDAPGPLDLQAFESREQGRGLAIVRDLIATWRGHLVVRSEPVPWTKAVGAAFWIRS